MPISSPLAEIKPVPPQFGCAGCGEDRLVERVFPVAGELLLERDAPGQRARAPADAADHHAIADLRCARGAERQRFEVETSEHLHEAEAGLLVDAKRMAFDHAAVAEMQPDWFRLR